MVRILYIHGTHIDMWSAYGTYTARTSTVVRIRYIHGTHIDMRSAYGTYIKIVHIVYYTSKQSPTFKHAGEPTCPPSSTTHPQPHMQSASHQ